MNALGRATEFLKAVINEQVAAGSSQLPARRVLCRRGRFSASTIQTALRLLEREGAWRFSPHGGFHPAIDPEPVHVASTPEAHWKMPEPPPEYRKWQLVYRQLREAILSGHYPAGTTLPQTKQLENLTGVGYRTVRKALAACTRERLVRCRGKRFTVYAPPRLRAPATLICITLTDFHRTAIIDTPFSAEFIRTIEHLARRYAFSISFVSIWDIMHSTANARRLLSIDTGAPVLGYVVWPLGFPPGHLNSLSHILSDTAKPVCVFDILGTTLPRAMYERPLFRVWQVGATELSGRIVGEYLRERGHRHAMFFLHETADALFLRRAQGIGEALSSAQNPQPVQLRGPEHSLALDTELDAFDVTGEFVGIGASIELLARACGTTPASPYGMILRNSAQYALWLQTMKPRMRPLFDRAMRDGNADAWVACNDLMGNLILEYLTQYPPGSVPAVVSFDDSLYAVAMGLTSYNFNVAAVVAEMVDFALGGLRNHFRSGRNPVEVRGFITERASSHTAITRHIPA